MAAGTLPFTIMADKVDAEDNEYLRVHETTDWAVVQSVIIINLAICEQHVAIMTFMI